jgi:hypothetical protein
MFNKIQHIKFIVYVIRRIRPIFWVIFIIVLAGILNYEWKLIPLLWVNKYTVGMNTVLVQILYSYITGFIFYFFVELLPQNKKRVVILRLVNNNSIEILRKARTILIEVCHANGVETNGDQHTIKREDFSRYCHAINIHSTQVKVWYYPQSSFKDFVLKSCEDIINFSNGMLTHADVFDENWILRLTQLIDSAQTTIAHLDINRTKGSCPG